VQEATVPLLTTWQNFYVIIGTAAGALIGLMFVVITLIVGDQMQRVRTNGGTIGAFSTPTVVHFCAALLVAATLCVPWQVLWNASLLLGLCGLGGSIYVIIVLRRTLRQTSYKPVLEDWLWHTIFPLISYLALLVAAIVLPIDPVPILFVVAAATVLFLFIGIHNAWDTVTYLTIERFQRKDRSQEHVLEEEASSS